MDEAKLDLLARVYAYILSDSFGCPKKDAEVVTADVDIIEQSSSNLFVRTRCSNRNLQYRRRLEETNGNRKEKILISPGC